MQYIPQEDLFRFTIIGTETDIADRLHYHALCAMLQEAACLDVDHHGFGADVMDSYHACWLLLRMRVDMVKIPKWKDAIYIRTWSNGYQKVLFNREFAILDEMKEEIGRATSVWIIAQQGDHRPIRPSTIPGMDVYACTEPSDQKIDKLFPPDEEKRESAHVLTRYADYSDIDRNMHVNNTRYIAWSEDSFYSQKDVSTQIRSMTINYASEVKPGEEVKIYRSNTEDGVQIDGFEVATGRHVFSSRFS